MGRIFKLIPWRSASSQPTVSTQTKSRIEGANPMASISSLASGLKSYFAQRTVTRSRPLPEDTGRRVHLLIVALFPAPVDPIHITQLDSSSPSESTNVKSSTFFILADKLAAKAMPKSLASSISDLGRSRFDVVLVAVGWWINANVSLLDFFILGFMAYICVVVIILIDWHLKTPHLSSSLILLFQEYYQMMMMTFPLTGLDVCVCVCTITTSTSATSAFVHCQKVQLTPI